MKDKQRMAGRAIVVDKREKKKEATCLVNGYFGLW